MIKCTFLKKLLRGSGKTFLYKALINYFIANDKNVLSMAWTGIASILLPYGMTSHRCFRLPLDLGLSEISFIKSDSDKKKLRETDVIIWDEASMIPKKALEIVDRTLKDICRNDEPFGGKLIILGGDFRQILPVVKYGSKNSILSETIKNSYVWKQFKTFKLTKNMRSESNKFSKFLLKIGEGKIENFEIPESWKTDKICDDIYGDKITINDDLTEKIILSSHNEDIYKINKKILDKLQTDERTYYSIDYCKNKGSDEVDENDYLNYQVEYLNSLTFPGFPVHKLKLKVGAIVMLIRNLNYNLGLCNGTRLKIINLYKQNIEAEIITGSNIGNIVFIPRIKLDTSEHSSLPFTLYRRQFPIVLAFAMTINKSQGQSFREVGLYLRRPLFSHGQLYVSLSRCRDMKKNFIQNEIDKNKDVISNIVWNEILD